MPHLGFNEVMANTPLSQIKNFGPVTLAEFEAIGLHTLEALQELGWEEVCRKWVESFPERVNVNAFIGVITTLDGMVWTQATASQKAQARRLVNDIRKEWGMPPVKPPKKQ